MLTGARTPLIYDRREPRFYRAGAGRRVAQVRRGADGGSCVTGAALEEGGP
jgi:hypothetical protein